MAMWDVFWRGRDRRPIHVQNYHSCNSLYITRSWLRLSSSSTVPQFILNQSSSPQNIEDMSPSTRVYSVEPQGYCDHEQSFLHPEKVRVANTGTPGVTICDALQASAPGKLTWQINSKHLSGATWMSDEAAVEAMKIAFQELKIITEPSGALGLAALLGGEIPVKKGDTVIVVACGGNVALQDYIDLLNKK